MEQTVRAREHTGTDSSKRRARKRLRGSIDYTLLMIVFVLLVFGLVMVYSTSYYTANLAYDDPAHWVLRQGIFAAIGVVLMLVIAAIPYDYWKNKSWILLVLVDIALVYVWAFGEEVNGAKRWLDLGFITVQPSEVAKFAVILSFAKLLEINYKRLGNFKIVCMTCIWILPTIAMVGIENFSTAIILVAIVGIMLFVASPSLKPVLGMAGFASVLVVILFSIKSYRGNRVKVWLDPEATPDGYQTLQSLYAIGSGGITGKGLGQSLQKLGFIPEAHNDMIFSIICEELGFVGAIGIIALFGVMIYRMLVLVVNAYDLYGALLVTGTIAHIGIQVLINIAVVTNTIPNTGVPLPFISYGGTSILFILAEMGIVLAVAKTTQRER